MLFSCTIGNFSLTSQQMSFTLQFNFEGKELQIIVANLKRTLIPLHPTETLTCYGLTCSCQFFSFTRASNSQGWISRICIVEDSTKPEVGYLCREVSIAIQKFHRFPDCTEYKTLRIEHNPLGTKYKKAGGHWTLFIVNKINRQSNI